MMTKIKYIASAWLIGIMGCTSLSEGQKDLPPGPISERVTYRGDVNMNLSNQMKEQVSEINRKRNIEEFDRNGPATTPTDLRPRQLPFAPIDSTRHNLYLPFRQIIKPIKIKQNN